MLMRNDGRLVRERKVVHDIRKLRPALGRAENGDFPVGKPEAEKRLHDLFAYST